MSKTFKGVFLILLKGYLINKKNTYFEISHCMMFIAHIDHCQLSFAMLYISNSINVFYNRALHMLLALMRMFCRWQVTDVHLNYLTQMPGIGARKKKRKKRHSRPSWCQISALCYICIQANAMHPYATKNEKICILHVDKSIINNNGVLRRIIFKCNLW